MPSSDTESPAKKKSLTIRLFSLGTQIDEQQFDEMIDLGRRQQWETDTTRLQRSPDGVLRYVIAPLTETSFPRDLLRVTPQFVGGNPISIVVDNKHREHAFSIDRIGTIPPKTSSTANLPSVIHLPGGYRIELDATDAHKTSPRGNRNQPSTQSPSMEQSILHLAELPKNKEGFGADTIFLSLLDKAITTLQRSPSDPDYFLEFARTVTEIAAFDRAEVVFWENNDWKYSNDRSYRRPTADRLPNLPSRYLLERAKDLKKTIIYPEGGLFGNGSEGNSITQLNFAIVVPLIDEQKQLLGVLYADRSTNHQRSVNDISDAEKRLIEILATGITSGLLKSKQEQLVTKYQQFFSPKITDAIRENPALLNGEETLVTVMFCDIRGFSRIAETIGSAKAMEWMSDTLSELSSIVLETDGVLIDYVGDELFAMWGAPQRTAKHATQAAEAAIAMANQRGLLTERWKSQIPQSLIPQGIDFGIGLCTGPARVGNTGSKQKFKYGPMGTTVNLGSRIQQLTKQWKVSILIDHETHERLSSDILRRRLGVAKVVGLDGTVELFELIPTITPQKRELVELYEAAYAIFESGEHPHEAAKAFGELVQKFPDDGPSLIMLVRSVNNLVDPKVPFTPVWTAKSV